MDLYSHISGSSGDGNGFLVKSFPRFILEFRKAYPAYTFRFKSCRNKLQSFLFLSSPVYEESSCFH